MNAPSSNHDWPTKFSSAPALQKERLAREAGSGDMQNYGDILTIDCGTDGNAGHFLRSVAEILFQLARRKPVMCDGKSNNVALKARSDMPSVSNRAAAHQGNGSLPVARWASGNAVDHWFNDQLSRLYAEMLSEPLPEELADLLEQMRRGKKSTAQRPI